MAIKLSYESLKYSRRTLNVKGVSIMEKKLNLLVMLVVMMALGLVLIGCPTESVDPDGGEEETNIQWSADLVGTWTKDNYTVKLENPSGIGTLNYNSKRYYIYSKDYDYYQFLQYYTESPKYGFSIVLSEDKTKIIISYSGIGFPAGDYIKQP
jgi:hypothetical protein